MINDLLAVGGRNARASVRSPGDAVKAPALLGHARATTTQLRCRRFLRPKNESALFCSPSSGYDGVLGNGRRQPPAPRLHTVYRRSDQCSSSGSEEVALSAELEDGEPGLWQMDSSACLSRRAALDASEPRRLRTFSNETKVEGDFRTFAIIAGERRGRSAGRRYRRNRRRPLPAH